jgi:hypothetical protein
MGADANEGLAAELMGALQVGSLLAVQELIERGLNPNLEFPLSVVDRGSQLLGHMSSWHGSKSLKRYPAFLEAVLRGSGPIVSALLEAGANASEAIDDGGSSRWSAVELASNEGHVEVVRLLCEHGGFAISDGRANLVKNLGFEVVECLSQYPQSPVILQALLASIARADLHVLQRAVPKLVAAGARIDAEESDDSPLCVAVAAKDAGKVAFLLAAGAAVTKERQSHAMKRACSVGADECISLLTAAGATVHERDIGTAVSSKNDDAIVAVLENCRRTGRSHRNMLLPRTGTFSSVVEAVIKAGHVKAARFLFEVLNEDPFQKTSTGASILSVSNPEIKQLIKAKRTVDAIGDVMGKVEPENSPSVGVSKSWGGPL